MSRDASEREVLIVVDVQRDFCPGGALAVPDGDAVIPAVNALARRFAHVVLTQDWHPPGHASFASSHPARRRSTRSNSITGRKPCGPTIACRAAKAPASIPPSTFPQSN